MSRSTTPLEPSAQPARSALPEKPRPPLLAPNWLQVSLILELLGAAVYVALNEHYLWGALLAVAGVAFGGSFVLRKMVGDEYGRS
jgi:hypothetical protein